MVSCDVLDGAGAATVLRVAAGLPAARGAAVPTLDPANAPAQAKTKSKLRFMSTQTYAGALHLQMRLPGKCTPRHLRQPAALVRGGGRGDAAPHGGVVLQVERLHAEHDLLGIHPVEPKQQAAQLACADIDFNHAAHWVAAQGAAQVGRRGGPGRGQWCGANR